MNSFKIMFREIRMGIQGIPEEGLFQLWMLDVFPEEVTREQGRIVTIDVRWPDVVADSEEEGLLARCQRVAMRYECGAEVIG